MKNPCSNWLTLALASAAVLAMSAACTVDPNTARRKTNTTPMNSADTGVSMSLDAGSNTTADTGTGGNNDCSGNPSMCVPYELRGNPPTCACLGVCEQGWLWQNGRCVQSGTMGNPDAGTMGNPRVDGGVPNTDPFNPATVASTYANALCAYRTRCEPAFNDYFSSSEMECVADFTAQLTASYTAYADIIGANRLGFSQSKLNSCLQALGAADCVLGADPSACSGIFTGSQGAGQPCSLTNECTSDNFCAIQQLGACGTCTPRAAAGASCAMALCAEGSRCLDLQSGPTCIPDTAGEGQPCNTIQTGLCRGRLQCVGSMSAVCQRPSSRGGMCASPDAMGNLLSPACNIYQNDVCVNGSCVAVNWGGAGTTCGDQTSANNCDGSARCDTNTMQCVAYPGMGETCIEGRCAEGLYCDVSTCAPEKTTGVACQSSAECSTELNLYCVNGTCGPLSYNFCQ